MARTSKYQTENAFKTVLKEWRAGLYIRLSREDGDKAESESVASQRALLERYVSERDDLLFSQTYIDDGWSGTDFERPAFQRMLGDVTAKKINCVVVKDLSRLGRNYVEAGKYLETVFPLFGVRFIAVNDQIDSFADPKSMNTVIVPFKNIMNDEYCRDISMKVRSALDIRRRQGKFIGAFAPYGYRKDSADHSRLVVDEAAARIVREIFGRFTEGYSIVGIARALNERGVPNPSVYRSGRQALKGGFWVDSTVRRILTNEVYVGNLVQKKNETVSYKIHRSRAVNADGRIKVERTHEAIIPQEQFDKVRGLLLRDTRTPTGKGQLSVFSGFIKCADCGRAMQKRTVKQPYKIYDYYVCSTYKKMHSHGCTKHTVRADALEKAVFSVLNRYIAAAVDFDRLKDKIGKSVQGSKGERLAAELSATERECGGVRSLLLDLYPDLKSGILSREQYFALKQKYEDKLASLERAAETLRRDISDLKSGLDTADVWIEKFKRYEGLSKLTRDVVVELIENIYVKEGGEIEIVLKCREPDWAQMRKEMIFRAEEDFDPQVCN